MRLTATIALLLVVTTAATAHGQVLPMQAPFDGEVRRHYYEQLRRSPWHALGYELLWPGAGSLYTGVFAAATLSMALSVGGAALWIAGARRDHAALRGVGIGAFAVGRAHGLVSAPVSAALLNAAFRRQLGLTARF
jgi:hypothetical protein